MAQFQADMPITGRYVFDPSISQAGTLMTVTDFQMMIGDYEVKQKPGVIRGDILVSPSEYVVVSLADGTAIGDGYVPSLMALQLTADIPLPDPTSPMPPAIERFSDPRWTLDFSSANGHVRLDGTVESLTVPEPSSSVLLGSALLGTWRRYRHPRGQRRGAR
jgi:hypothetical protein